MVGNNLYYKRYIEKMIEQHGHDIEIVRSIKVDDGYGGSKSTDLDLNARVVFYNKKLTTQSILDAGIQWSRSTAIKILAADHGDLKEGDRIKIQGKEYKATNLIPYLGICIQSELERIE